MALPDNSLGTNAISEPALEKRDPSVFQDENTKSTRALDSKQKLTSVNSDTHRTPVRRRCMRCCGQKMGRLSPSLQEPDLVGKQMTIIQPEEHTPEAGKGASKGMRQGVQVKTASRPHTRDSDSGWGQGWSNSNKFLSC